MMSSSISFRKQLSHLWELQGQEKIVCIWMCITICSGVDGVLAKLAQKGKTIVLYMWYKSESEEMISNAYYQK